MEITKTYAESKDRTPFDWNLFLNKKDIGEQEWDHARELAKDWVTCACGNQCEIIPRKASGEPKDLVLLDLGDKFFLAIRRRYKERAKQLLQEIEKRSLLLIEEITKSN